MKIKKIFKPNAFKIWLTIFIVFLHVISFYKLMDCAFGSGRSILCKIVSGYWNNLENFFFLDGFAGMAIGFLIILIIIYIISSILVHIAQNLTKKETHANGEPVL